jgi:nucleoside-diphosphate-sugar epimerase
VLGLMRLVCITGASSFIGQHFVDQLSTNEDIQLRVLVHNRTPEGLRDNKRITSVRGDLLDPSSLKKLIAPGCVVVNLAYLKHLGKQQNIRAAQTIFQACEDVRVKRLIHCSTAAVSGRVNTRFVDELTPCRPVSEYEATKLEIEQLFLNKSQSSAKFDVVILRPTAVFGPGGKNLIKLADSLTNGSTLLNYIKSCVHNKRRMNAIYVDNVTACLSFLCLTDLDIDGQIFIISDDESSNNNYRFIETVLLRSVGRPDYFMPRVPAPSMLVSMALRVLGRSNDNPFRIYSAKKLLNLGFEKPVSFEFGLTRFAEWYKNSHMS